MKKQKQKLIKIVFNSILTLGFLLFILFLDAPIANSATTITKDFVSDQSQILNAYPLPCDTPSLCSTIEIDCWNSEAVGVTNCGNFCSGGDPWTKYTFLRDTAVDCRQFDEFRCVAVFHSDGVRTCSTGDKFNSANPPVLNAGFCNCTVGGGYKTCCSNGLAVSANSFDVDPYPPPEGGCGNNTIVFCGGTGQPPCGQAACAPLATPTPTPTPTPTGCGTALTCTNPQCSSSGYIAVKLTSGNYVCVNSSTGQIDCSVTASCPSGCPTTAPWTGETCQCGSGNVPTTCASNPKECNTCSLKYCLISPNTPSLCCYYQDTACFKNDSNNCKNLNCGSDKCIPGSTRTTCSAPNVCPAP